MATKRYISNRDCLDRGDMVFAMGEHCEFDDEQAAPLLALGAIFLPEDAPGVAPVAATPREPDAAAAPVARARSKSHGKKK